jgi:hypothetical protein
MTDSTTLIHVPATAADLVPPSPADVLNEAMDLVRNHWDELHNFYTALSGETPSITGDADLDEAKLVFAIKNIATGNGFDVLGTLSEGALKKVHRKAYKKVANQTIGQLLKQSHRLRIEARKGGSAN